MKEKHKTQGSWGTLGLEIVLCILFGYFGGHWLDGRFGTAPWLSVVGFVFGCGAAAKALFRVSKEMQAVAAREERQKGNPAPVYERPEDRKDRAADAPASQGGSLGGPAAPREGSEGEHDGRAS